MRLKIITATLVVVSGLTAFGGEISTLYSKESNGGVDTLRKSRTHKEVEAAHHGITEIGIERTRCYGTCPSYTFIVKSDGTFRYIGEKYAKREGEFTGKINTRDFDELAQFIKDSDYMALEQKYSRLVTDNPTVFTTVVMNGQRKIISNYAKAGPTKLWAIEKLIDDLMSKAEWSESPTPPDKQK